MVDQVLWKVDHDWAYLLDSHSDSGRLSRKIRMPFMLEGQKFEVSKNTRGQFLDPRNDPKMRATNFMARWYVPFYVILAKPCTTAG